MFKILFRIVLVLIILLVISQLEYRDRKLQTYAEEFFKSLKGKSSREDIKGRVIQEIDDSQASSITDEDRKELIEILE